MVYHIGRKIRLLRVRNGWRQSDVAARADVSRGLVSLIERDALASVTLGALQRVVQALDARLAVDVLKAGAELDRLMDAGHAALAEWLAASLIRRGWLVRAEVSFNHFGDRGRYDLLAYHPGSAHLLVAEVKTAVGDLQDLLGKLDVKVRLARDPARSLGWRPSAITPLLLLAESDTNRRRLRDHPTLFAAFDLRGRQASAWLNAPSTPAPRGLLMFRKLSNATHRGLIRVQRVRKSHTRIKAANAGNTPDDGR